MRKLQEFEMFKKLMLDKHQEKIFSSLPKPNLTNLDLIEVLIKNSKNKGFSGSSVVDRKNTKCEKDENNDDVDKAYLGLKNRENKEVLDRKLLKAFEETMLRSKNGTRRNTFNFRRLDENAMLREEGERASTLFGNFSEPQERNLRQRTQGGEDKDFENNEDKKPNSKKEL